MCSKADLAQVGLQNLRIISSEFGARLEDYDAVIQKTNFNYSFYNPANAISFGSIEKLAD